MIKKLIYLSILFLTSVNTYAQEMYKVSRKLNVRATENPMSNIIGYIPSGENVAVLDSSNLKYFKIKVTNAVGFVDSKFLIRIQQIEQKSNIDEHNLNVVTISFCVILFLALCYYLFQAKTRKYAFVLILVLILGGGGYFGYNTYFNKEDEAIQLVQKSNFGIDNLLKTNFFLLMTNPNPTNLEVANLMANARGNENFVWRAKKVEQNIYLVIFLADINKKALLWEVNTDSKIVRNVTYNDILIKKYKSRNYN